MAESRYATNIGVAAALLCVPASLPASAGDASIAIGGHVPTICRVTLAQPQTIIRPGRNDLGQMTELCNSTQGYRVTLYHPRGLYGAAVLIEGQRVEISPAASHTVLVDTSAPAYRARAVQLILPEQPASDLAISINAQPKGAQF